MSKQAKLTTLLIVFFIFIFGSPVWATSIEVGFGGFYADPTVDINPSGLSATLYEDPGLGSVLLSNDPYFGDPGIPIPENVLTLQFAYIFSEAAGNSDYFYAKVFNGDTGEILCDFMLGNPNVDGEYYHDQVYWDLSLFNFSGVSRLGLEFQLNSDDMLYDSYLAVGKIYFQTDDAPQIDPVPEPSTVMLLGIGLIGLVNIGRKRFIQK